MLKILKNPGDFFFLLVVFCIVTPFVYGHFVFQQLIKPVPIEKVHPAQDFKVLGFTKSGKPTIVMLEDSPSVQRYLAGCTRKEIRHNVAVVVSGPVLLKEDNRAGGPYTFSLDPKLVKSINQELLKESTNGQMYHYSISILSGDKNAKTQKLHLAYHGDDTDRDFIYSVSNNEVKALEFGDITKSDFGSALGTGEMASLILFFLGLIWLAYLKIASWRSSRRISTNNG